MPRYPMRWETQLTQCRASSLCKGSSMKKSMILFKIVKFLQLMNSKTNLKIFWSSIVIATIFLFRAKKSWISLWMTSWTLHSSNMENLERTKKFLIWRSLLMKLLKFKSIRQTKWESKYMLTLKISTVSKSRKI